MSKREIFENASLKLYAVSRVFIYLAENDVMLNSDVVSGLYCITQESFEELKSLGKDIELSIKEGTGHV
jgi:hypothetical protein